MVKEQKTVNFNKSEFELRAMNKASENELMTEPNHAAATAAHSNISVLIIFSQNGLMDIPNLSVRKSVLYEFTWQIIIWFP